MFRRILIANRGEVALRIARTAREMGISPVGVVSTADRESAWARAMDQVVCIGEAAPGKSYLRAQTIVQAALQTGCSAVHPGWGFLAESPGFAALCQQHGVTFIGPPAGLIQSLGLKAPAKAAMSAAGLEVIPGSPGRLPTVQAALDWAKEVGYPVLLKADAGGGGRGMRRCANDDELRTGFAAAAAESLAAFGDGGLYLEKCIEDGRHIEVQLLADRFGHAVHLGERECSIQRSHQKLLEESPSPALSDTDRDELGLRAAQAARFIGYIGAGTIEFLRDASGRLYFMEMNARLQVEHPVSEMRCGIDIVAEQLRIAANEPLRLQQSELTLTGHTIECRINAEDPAQGFRPTPGLLTAFAIPTDCGPGNVRVETHLASGEEVTPHYDSLMAKVITHGLTRDAAIETMLATLAQVRITGVSTTIPLHLAILDSATFRAGTYNTSSIPGWQSPAAKAS
ncbi:MAG: acetyl-CoA carboxylase biotin carboxylase subunit [Planctomycetes bacterium]|jgi:acetyl-CoA carboxylase biotin carboxylase subunit|nr:acetyl-CoA carboxylase biotin carboxylase subunit [Planctomycetota bacterium]HJO25630.1 biotin carboxylase N-terminal domain-containing protein [Planctomycetota bacterium]